LVARADVVHMRPGSDGAGWFRALPEVRGLARELRPDCVHGHYATSYGMWAAACRSTAPVVVTAWGSDILVTPRERGWRGAMIRAVLRRTLRRADLITADADSVLEEIARYRVRAPLHRVLWGVDTARFRPAGDPKRNAGGFELLSLRQWEPNYRIDVILKAFAKLRSARPALRSMLTLLGGGPLEPGLRTLAADLGLDDRAVRFVGRVDDAGMIAALDRADVSVSVPASDATSVAMLEAMACGLPLVVTDLPANRAWIEPGQRIPVDDVDALVATLVRLADDPAARVALGRRNRELVVEHASRADQMDRMASLYDVLLARRGRATA
jgi:glycosyltransferase involved in cell wall biosynthesis